MVNIYQEIKVNINHYRENIDSFPGENNLIDF